MNTSRHHALPASRRGAVLITALLLATGLAIAIGSYVQITSTNLKISGRAFHNNSAMNLAETGLEEAMWSINQNMAGNASAWSGWTLNGSEATRTFGPFDLAQNTVGYTRVYVSSTLTSGAIPTVVAKASITPPNQASVDKWVSIILRQRSIFASGLVAKKSLTFHGNNASVDSWNSKPSGTVIPYSAGVRHDAGTVASLSVAVDMVLVNNADIWGYVATGYLSDDVSGNVGANGSVLGTTSAAQDKSSWVNANVDPSRISTDFTSSLSAVTAPTATYTALGNVSNNLTLPQAGDVAAADGKYYYSATGVSLTNKTLTVGSNKAVVLVATGDVSTGGGSGSIQINNGGSLALYAAADVTLSGNGVANGTASATTATTQQPVNFQIWGTSTTSQSINIKGNGVLSAVVYAPNASLFINGNGDVEGSFVANDVVMVGNAAFHYDESLGQFGGRSPYGISKWTELTSATQRATYQEKLAF